MPENGNYFTKLADSEVIKLVQANQQVFATDSESVDDIQCQVQSHEERERERERERDSMTYLKIKWSKVKPYQLQKVVNETLFVIKHEVILPEIG